MESVLGCSSASEENAINIRANEIVLTPLTCASILAEIIKCVIYQKSQIPYHYNMLKHEVSSVRRSENPIELKKLAAKRYFQILSNTYDNLESLILNLNSQFDTSACDIKQVLIIFGTNIHCPREIFKIKFSGLKTNHYEHNHSKSNIRYQHKILQTILFAEKWLRAMDNQIPLTSIFLMLQKQVGNVQELKDDEFLLPVGDYTPPSIGKCLHINVHCENDSELNCCNNFVIFEDNPNESCNETKIADLKPDSKETSDDMMWFQSKLVLRGFKPSKSKLW